MNRLLDMTVRFVGATGADDAMAPVMAMASEEMSIGDMWVGKTITARRGAVEVQAELLAFRQEYD